VTSVRRAESVPEREHAAATIGGANPFVGLSRGQVAAAAGRWAAHLVADPAVATDHALRLAGGLVRIAAGASTVEPERGDRRFERGIDGFEHRLHVINGRILARLMPHATLRVVPDAGHLFIVDQPHDAAAIVSDFLAGSPHAAYG
jgi:pimeloyl-ACP methyl ester carboxylesterase